MDDGVTTAHSDLFLANYRCLKCGTERGYGYEHSLLIYAKERLEYDPLIKCKTCVTATRHRYIAPAGN
jgi:DNA-directed RNA polymerase subunit RPC12/RpoP